LSVLEIKNGASHSEIKVMHDGTIKIIEIAARMGGDFIGSDMVAYSTGFDYMKAVINISMGKSVDFSQSLRNRIALVRFFIDEEDIQRFFEIKAKYPDIIKHFCISHNILKVSDSSSRNGFCVLEIQGLKQLDQIIGIFNLDSSIF
jgi:hypothetical protein